MNLPPIANFIAFHPSRVEFLRRHREKLLSEPVKIKLKPVADEDSESPKPRKPRKAQADLFANLSVKLDPKTQAAVLEALKLRRTK